MSPKASPAQVSFNAGHFSPRLFGRIDLEKYASACNTLDNFLPSVQGPAIKRSGFRFVHEAKRLLRTDVVQASWGGEVRADGVKASPGTEDLAGRLSTGVHRWAQKFATTSFTGPATAITMAVKVVSLFTITAGHDIGAYGTAGGDDPQADSGATMYSRCANSGEYLNDTTQLTTTGVKTFDLGAQAVRDFNAQRSIANTFSVSCRYANEAAAADTGSTVNEYTTANPPALSVTWLSTADASVRLIPFEFSTDQAYTLEFGAGYMRVFKDGGIVLDASKTITGTTNATPVQVTTSAAHGYSSGHEVLISGTGVSALDGRYWYIRVTGSTTFDLLESTAPGSTSATGTSSKVFELSTPYTTYGDVANLSFAQSADTLYIAHSNYPPAKITRTDHNAWTHTPITFDYPPFAAENLTLTTTIDTSAGSGAVTLTASAAIFTADMVGTLVKIRGISESIYPPWKEQTDYATGTSHEYDQQITGSSSINVGDAVHHLGRVYTLSTKTAGSKTGRVAPVHETGSYGDGAWTWEFLNYGYGYATITGFTSSTIVSATVNVPLPRRGNNSSRQITSPYWSFGAFSAVRGYPKAVCFFEDRLIWAGTASDPDTLFCSRTGRYEDHRVTDEDDSAMVLALNSTQINSIEWMAAQSVLQIGTAGAEWASKEADGPITPDNVSSRIKQRSAYGSREVLPAQIENVVIFAQRSGRKLRELTPPSSLDTSTEEAPDLTLLAEDYTAGLVKEMAFQSEPDRVLWVIMETGVLYGFTYEKAQQVTGWHRHPVGGTNTVVESICVIPHPEGNKDQLWASIRRTIGSVTRRYIEALDPLWMPGDAIADAFFVDSGLTYDGSAATTISGLFHLEGQTVAVLADGLYVGTQTVSSGAITLSTAASKVQVGLPYTATVETLRIEAGGGDGVAQGDTKRIGNVVVRIYQTGKGLYVSPSTFDLDNGVRTVEITQMEDFQADQGVEILEGTLYGGDTRPVPFPGGWEQKGRIALRHTTPIPCQISAIFPTLVSNDR